MVTQLTFHNAEVVVDDLGERGEAVGGAGGVGHHVVARLVLLVVHTLQTHLYKWCGSGFIESCSGYVSESRIRIKSFDDQKKQLHVFLF
jgi:hypothetical protein